jgi:hypothetical protein
MPQQGRWNDHVLLRGELAREFLRQAHQGTSGFHGDLQEKAKTATHPAGGRVPAWVDDRARELRVGWSAIPRTRDFKAAFAVQRTAWCGCDQWKAKMRLFGGGH